MTSVKSVVGIVAALLPVAYCGGLLYYFTQNNTLSGPVGQGLGPTVLGLGAVGLLFCAPVIFKLLKLAAPRKPEAGKVRDEADEEPVSSFDADAALARYMARKAAAGGEIPAAAAPVARGGFGRKTV